MLCYKDLLDKRSSTRERNTVFLDVELGIFDSGGEASTNSNTDHVTEEVETVPEEEEVQEREEILSLLRSLTIMCIWLCSQQKMEIHLNLETMQRL